MITKTNRQTIYRCISNKVRMVLYIIHILKEMHDDLLPFPPNYDPKHIFKRVKIIPSSHDLKERNG